MGLKSRDKGKVGEREARDQVRQHWDCPNCVRSAQVSGKFTGDLMGGPAGLHLEVKRYKRITTTDFMKQAIADAGEGEIPVVLMREDYGTWLALVRMEDTRAFAGILSPPPEDDEFHARLRAHDE